MVIHKRFFKLTMQVFFAWMLGGLFASAAAYSKPSTLRFESGKKQVNLVELYTSEGCSSCPPAEKFLNSLGKDAELWKTFVPIAFRVDYWNYLGWRDVFSKKQYSVRQRQYNREMRESFNYTPGLAVNGDEWRFRRSKKRYLVADKTPGNLVVDQISEWKFRVRFYPEKKTLSKLKVYGALMGSGLVTRVVSGENEGSKLKHDFVAFDLKTGRMKSKKDYFEGVIKLTPSVVHKPKSLSVVFWVGSDSKLAPIQVAGSEL